VTTSVQCLFKPAIRVTDFRCRHGAAAPFAVEYSGLLHNSGENELHFGQPAEFPLMLGVLVFQETPVNAPGESDLFRLIAEDRPAFAAAMLAPGESCPFSGSMVFTEARGAKTRWLFSLVSEHCAWLPNATADYMVFDVVGDDDLVASMVDIRAQAAWRAGHEAPQIMGALDSRYYTEQFPHLGADELELHYCTTGVFSFADPTPRFCTYDYVALNPGLMVSGANPFLHCLNAAIGPGVSQLIDWRLIEPAFRASAPTHVGEPETIVHQPLPQSEESVEIEVVSREFDWNYYRETYEDIALNNLHPVEHYCFHGWREGRDPAPWFSTRRYLHAYEDVSSAGVNPFLHYITRGRKEGRRIWPARAEGAVELWLTPGSRLVTDPSLRSLIDYIPSGSKIAAPPERAAVVRRKSGRLDIHWVIPDFAIGSGGHTTIFRMMRFLELRGHRCHLWLTSLHLSKSVEEAYDKIIRAFPTIGADIRLVEDGLGEAWGDAIVATGWDTVPAAASLGRFAERFYFVQDFEPSFFPVGSYSLAAEATYAFYRLNCICASPWLARVMQERYQLPAQHFGLAYDAEIYNVLGRTERSRRKVKRVAIYARLTTPRRAVELVFLGLELLAAAGFEFAVDFFGSDLDFLEAPFAATSHGILSPTELADLYRSCDLGVCFSATNYSLVPQEMMACGLPVLELDGDSTRHIYPQDVVLWSQPHPREIASAIRTALSSPPLLARTAKRALAWVAQFTWDKAGAVVEETIAEKLGVPVGGNRRRRARARPEIRASVCIPTLNGGNLLLTVVDRVLEQITPWGFELLIMDSSSDDGSIERLPRHPALRVERISRAEFQHGRTRNALAELSRGDYIAFLTQDALPLDRYWLHHFVTVLSHFPDAAGAFGRHSAWPEATSFTRRDIDNAFEAFGADPLRLARDTDPLRYANGDIGWRQRLHFFSDNNSLLCRRAWQEIPFPEVDFGEDQVWADRIIQAGHAKVYVPSAVVYHSHDYSPDQTRKRMRVEADFFRDQFGYILFNPDVPFDIQVERMNARDRAWGAKHNVSEAEIGARCEENRARLLGYRDSYETRHTIGIAAQ
jgi:glycosyltransferase involved in cell wall biosynthesis